MKGDTQCGMTCPNCHSDSTQLQYLRCVDGTIVGQKRLYSCDRCHVIFSPTGDIVGYVDLSNRNSPQSYYFAYAL